MTSVFEVVTVQVNLGARGRFAELHREVLLPACHRNGIRVVACLMAEVGQVGRVVDIYEYSSYADYSDRSAALEADLTASGYYEQIQLCIAGTIQVELMTELNGSAWAAVSQ